MASEAVTDLQPDYLAAEARRWLGPMWNARARIDVPATPAMLRVREALTAYYGDINAVFPLKTPRLQQLSLLAEPHA